MIRSAGYQVVLSEEQQQLKDRLLDRFASNPYVPPTSKEAIEYVGGELFNALS